MKLYTQTNSYSFISLKILALFRASIVIARVKNFKCLPLACISHLSLSHIFNRKELEIVPWMPYALHHQSQTLTLSENLFLFICPFYCHC